MHFARRRNHFRPTLAIWRTTLLPHKTSVSSITDIHAVMRENGNLMGQ
jgi:hypothetical protein